MFVQGLEISQDFTPHFTRGEKSAVGGKEYRFFKEIRRDIKQLEVNQKFYKRSVEHPTQMKLEALFEVALSASVIAATIIGCYLCFAYISSTGGWAATSVLTTPQMVAIVAMFLIGVVGWFVSLALGGFYDVRWEGGAHGKGHGPNYFYPAYIPIVGPLVALWKGLVTNYEAKRNGNLTSLRGRCMKHGSSEKTEKFEQLLNALEGKKGECDAANSAKEKLEKLFNALQPSALQKSS